MTDLHNPDDHKVDLGALDFDHDPRAEQRFLSAVMTRVANRPRPAVLPTDPLVGVWSVLRSPLLAAGIVVAAVIGTYGLTHRSPAGPQNVAQAIGVPAAFMADAAAPSTVPDSR
jgi:hypothetical protein